METSAYKRSRFKEPVSDAFEEEMRTNAVPDKTKAVTAWGIGIYTEWAAHRASKTSSVSGVRDLETPLLSMRSEELSYWLGKFGIVASVNSKQLHFAHKCECKRSTIIMVYLQTELRHSASFIIINFNNRLKHINYSSYSFAWKKQ